MAPAPHGSGPPPPRSPGGKAWRALELARAARIEEALREGEAAAGELEAAGSARPARLVRLELGWLLTRAGRLDEARQQTALARRSPGAGPGAACLSVWIAAQRGEAVEDPMVGRERRRPRADPDLPEADGLRLLALGRTGEAAEAMEELAAAAQHGPQDAHTRLAALCLRATALRLEAERASPLAPSRSRTLLRDASEAADEAASLARREPAWLPHALREQGLLLALRGSERKALARIDAGLAAAHERGLWLEHGRTLLARARLGVALQSQGAERELAMAVSSLRALGAAVDEPGSRPGPAGADERGAAQRDEVLRDFAQALHDGAGQTLSAAALQLVSIARRADAPLAARLADVRQLVTSTLDELRTLSHDLRPAALERLGLEGALRELCRGATCPELPVEFEAASPPVPERAAPEAAAALYRIAQAALANTLRHARASRAVVRLRATDAALRLEIEDDGIGFDPDEARARGGIGLQGMTERATRLGGSLRFLPGPAGGCRVEVELPLPPAPRP